MVRMSYGLAWTKKSQREILWLAGGLGEAWGRPEGGLGEACWRPEGGLGEAWRGRGEA